MNQFNELLYHRILSIEYYVTKYKLDKNQSAFLRSAVDNFYYPIISQKVIVSLLDDTQKLHFLGEDYLKKHLIKPLGRIIYRTLHDFLSNLCDALERNGGQDLKEQALINITNLVY